MARIYKIGQPLADSVYNLRDTKIPKIFRKNGQPLAGQSLAHNCFSKNLTILMKKKLVFDVAKIMFLLTYTKSFLHKIFSLLLNSLRFILS